MLKQSLIRFIIIHLKSFSYQDKTVVFNILAQICIFFNQKYVFSISKEWKFFILYCPCHLYAQLGLPSFGIFKRVC